MLEEIREEHNFEEIIGHSQCLVDVIGKMKLVAKTDASVLILGESGTGKELIARAVHANSPAKRFGVAKFLKFSSAQVGGSRDREALRKCSA